MFAVRSDQHRQAPRPFAVPSGLHALRSDPDDAGSQVASADAAFLPYAAGATAVRRCLLFGPTNDAKRRVHSLFRQGCMLYDLIPTMPEARLRPLMQRFSLTLHEQPLFADVFGPI